jgi:hypothetical protein
MQINPLEADCVGFGAGQAYSVALFFPKTQVTQEIISQQTNLDRTYLEHNLLDNIINQNPLKPKTLATV